LASIRRPGRFFMRLAPGEVFRILQFFLGAFSGGVDTAGNCCAAGSELHCFHPDLSDPRYPLLVNNSWGSGMAVDESLALRMIRESAELGLENVSHGCRMVPQPRRLAARSQKIPRRFGTGRGRGTPGRPEIWLVGGLVPGPDLVKPLERSTSAIRSPRLAVNDLPADWKPEEFKGQTIDIGVPAARLWAEAETKRIVEEYKTRHARTRRYLVAKGCDRSDHPHAPAHPANTVVQSLSPWTWTKSSNSTDVSYHATNAYYSIQDKLRREHPGFCWKSATTAVALVDFGSAAHADYFSIADAYDPLSNRRAFFDASHVFPPAMLEPTLRNGGRRGSRISLYASQRHDGLGHGYAGH